MTVVLFACIHNSGRSVAAQVLARQYGLDARSAGSEPGAGVNPLVAQVLGERGFPVEDHVPTLLTFEGVQEADVVVTMGCGETCPVLPGKRYEDWLLDDPKDQPLDVVRRIVAEIDQRVKALAASL
ncbi:MAG: low molecular weight phosphatase family protein [Mycobacteriales bacterium]